MQSNLEINQFDEHLWQQVTLKCNDGSEMTVPVTNDVDWLIFTIESKLNYHIRQLAGQLLYSLLQSNQIDFEWCLRRIKLKFTSKRVLNIARIHMPEDNEYILTNATNGPLFSRLELARYLNLALAVNDLSF